MEYSKEKIDHLRHRWTTVKGKALIKAIKKHRSYLSPVLYRERVSRFVGINDKELGDDGIDLRGAPLSGFDFRTTIEEEDGYYEKLAILSNIHFEGALLKHCIFQDSKIYDCYFNDADLSHSEFKTATLHNCNLKNTNLSGASFRGASLTNCDFTEAEIKDMILDSTVVDEKTTFGKKLKSEIEKNFHFASIEYKQIKEMYKNSSLHSYADKYHHKEMVAKRKTDPIKNPIRALNYIFGDLLCKYGTSFIRVMFWSIIFMIACALAYQIGDSILFQNSPTHTTFADAMYFSIVTFTTLGYGDYHAVGWVRFLAASESFIGAALMALFTVIVARHIIRD